MKTSNQAGDRAPDFGAGMVCLSTFAWDEFDRLQGGYDAGTFFGSVNQVRRYWEFLDEIYKDHVRTVAAYRSVHAKVMNESKRAKPGKSYPWSKAQQTMMELFPKLDLEVQSFYIFAKILLGNIAQMIELYFGPARNCSLGSHDKFRKHFELYRDTKSLAVTPALAPLLETLQQTIVDHRDKEYEHLETWKRPHTTSSVEVTDDGHIVLGQMPAAYPDMRRPIEITKSEPLHLLLTRLSDYMVEVTKLLETNRQHTSLASQQPNPSAHTQK